ncbi:tetratricopeptide repeat protein [Maribacter sp. 2304DJ31-5]|uniref:tetratricopeptide repeat protein n=1 Tax=Maribacter sp. 2304DJ31-5 TaxID=3386273 RepID=UPI0039BD3882
MGKKIFILYCLCFSIWSNAQNEAVFNKATSEYNEGNYQKAIDHYLDILESGQHSAAVYFNLGNSYYKLNEIASSIYYYEKALLLTPNDPEIKNNLGYARNMTLDAIETLPETGLSKLYKSITTIFSFDQWAYLAIVFMLLFVLLYITFYYSRYSARKRWAFISSLISLFITIVAVLFAFTQFNDFEAEQPAIVFADEIGIKSEPNPSSQEVFSLHAGTKVNVLDKLNEWKKIRISDGKTGWILSGDIKLLKDF